MTSSDDQFDAWIGVGANQGDASQTLSEAQRALRRLSHEPLDLSSLYISEPWGGVEQEPFINQVIYIRVSSCKLSEFMSGSSHQLRDAPLPRGSNIANLSADLSASPYVELSQRLLGALLIVEQMFGRDRSRETRWGPRPLDLDLLAVHGGSPPQSIHCESEELTLPHPRLHLRRFVLAPWAELSPQLEVSPALGYVGELLNRCPDSCSIERITGLR